MTNEEFRAARLKFGLSQVGMGRLMTMSQSRISELETGADGRQPTLQHAGRVEIIKFVAAHGLLDKLFITMAQKKR